MRAGARLRIVSRLPDTCSLLCTLGDSRGAETTPLVTRAGRCGPSKRITRDIRPPPASAIALASTAADNAPGLLRVTGPGESECAALKSYGKNTQYSVTTWSLSRVAMTAEFAPDGYRKVQMTVCPVSP